VAVATVSIVIAVAAGFAEQTAATVLKQLRLSCVRWLTC
jgi:hypothetical protein